MFLGDIVGRAAREKVVRELPHIKTEYMIDFAIVNGENSAGGFGITEDICKDLFSSGVDCITTGNHLWDQREILDFISDEDRLLRPVNFPNHTPGSGFNIFETEKGKICFAQTVPTKRAPGAIQREQSKLFVTFRPGENIKDEVSVTSGHDYKSSTVTASSGKKRYSFFSQKNFAWLLDDQEERNFIKLMKRATNLIVKARTTKGAETTDHYSMMGFTKAYNTAKKTCG